jgi:NAD(P)-dependent dehydrogenase (short-subunit alcohol dehydrogenase family)
MELIKDKVVIVTGAAAGIGAGVARLFAEQGAHVFLVDLDGAAGQKDRRGDSVGRRLSVRL